MSQVTSTLRTPHLAYVAELTEDRETSSPDNACMPHSLDVRALQQWRTTSDRADHAASAILTQRFLTALSPFLRQPVVFRNILRLTSAIISGSTALHVLDIDRAHDWTPSDLDIYVPVHNARRLISYLCVEEGYSAYDTDNSKYPYYPPSGMRGVTHLRRSGLEIDIIQSSTRSALHPLPYFWSTHVMNYLTADSFCIAYPDFTLRGHGLFNPVQLVDFEYPRPRTLSVVKKYTDRGYCFRGRPLAWAHDPGAECTSGPGCPHTQRHFGDEFCLMGSFHAGGAEQASPDGLYTVRWTRGGRACGGECQHMLAKPVCDDVSDPDAVRPRCATIQVPLSAHCDASLATTL
ncbi:hypothetical protein VTO73DRAFT_7153 [Trametes versicolor]